jgi:hypothetical protein
MAMRITRQAEAYGLSRAIDTQVEAAAVSYNLHQIIERLQRHPNISKPAECGKCLRPLREVCHQNLAGQCADRREVRLGSATGSSNKPPFRPSGRIASAFVRGVQAQGVAATAKHFPGYPAVIEDPFHSVDVSVAGRARRQQFPKAATRRIAT